MPAVSFTQGGYLANPIFVEFSMIGRDEHDKYACTPRES